MSSWSLADDLYKLVQGRKRREPEKIQGKLKLPTRPVRFFTKKRPERGECTIYLHTETGDTFCTVLTDKPPGKECISFEYCQNIMNDEQVYNSLLIWVTKWRGDLVGAQILILPQPEEKKRWIF